MQSGTLVPAAKKVMPMMTSGIPSVKPITVTWQAKTETDSLLVFGANVFLAVEIESYESGTGGIKIC